MNQGFSNILRVKGASLDELRTLKFRLKPAVLKDGVLTLYQPNPTQGAALQTQPTDDLQAITAIKNVHLWIWFICRLHSFPIFEQISILNYSLVIDRMQEYWFPIRCPVAWKSVESWWILPKYSFSFKAAIYYNRLSLIKLLKIRILCLKVF